MPNGYKITRIGKPLKLPEPTPTRAQVPPPTIEAKVAPSTMPDISLIGEPGRGWEIPYPVILETGETIEARLRPDGSVWAGAEQIGTVDPTTGAFTRREPTTLEYLGQALGQAGSKAMEYAFKPFEYFEEYFAKPIAMALTAPGWIEEAPEARLDWDTIQQWFNPEGEFREAYTKWEAPKFLKGTMELLPWFAIPPVARVAAWAGKAGKAGQVVAKAMSPAVKAELAAGKLITLPLKGVGKLAGRIMVRPKELTAPALPDVKELVLDTLARHPERLRAGTHIEESFLKANILKNKGDNVAQQAREVLLGPLYRWGLMDDIFKIKDVPIPGTPFKQRLCTSPYIKPKKSAGGSMAMRDILQFPDRYQWVGAEGEYARNWRNLYTDLVETMKKFRRENIEAPLNEMAFAEGESWIPSRVIGRFNKKTGEIEHLEPLIYSRGRRPGALTPSWRKRKFKSQWQALKEGWIYAPEDAVLDTFIIENYNMAIGDQAVKLLRELGLAGKTPLEIMDKSIRASVEAVGNEIKDLNYIKNVALSVKRGVIKIPGATYRAVAKRDPEAARSLRAILDQRASRMTMLEREVASLQSRLASEVEAASGLKIAEVSSQAGSGKTIAVAADPSKKYVFKFKVVEAEEPIASHTTSFNPNPDFPKKLQPRLRARAMPRDQVDRMARELDPEALLIDTHRLDSGSMIIGADGVIESGNGRIIAIRRAIEEYPERYAAYRRQLEETAGVYGIDLKKLKEMKNPVLVRVRQTEVDRVKFVREANESVSAVMSKVELAFADSHFIPEASLTRLQIEGKESLESALKDIANSDFVRDFLSRVPAVERGQFLAADGTVSLEGIKRISGAILAKAFEGGFGLRLVEKSLEAINPTSKLIITGLAGSAGDLAKLGVAIKRGTTDDAYYIALDLAEAAERYLRAKEGGILIEQVIQPSLFNPGTTPIQEALIRALEERAKSATKIRDFIRQYVDGVMALPPPGQAAMPGFAPPTREGLLGRIIGKEIPKSPVLKPARAEVPAPGKAVEPKMRLEEPPKKEPPKKKPPKKKPEEVKPVEVPEEMVPPEATLEREAYLREFVPGYERELSLEGLLRNLNERLVVSKGMARELQPQFLAARERAVSAAIHEGRIIDMPAFRNRIFTDIPNPLNPKGPPLMTGREVAERITKIYGPEKVSAIIKTASKMARFGVTVKAALDLSWMFIQGSLVLGYDASRWAVGKKSTAWFNGTRAMLQTIFDPKYAGDFMAKHPALAKRCAEMGVVLERETEFIQTAQMQQMIKKVPHVGKFLGTLIKHTYGRAGAGFSTGGKVARMTMVEQLEKSWLSSGKSPNELGELVNKLSGVISSAELGVSPTRRALESALLFAPRYTRAYLMVMRDLFRGTATGAEVRKAMAGMMVGGTLSYVTLCTILGQEPKLNPAPKSLGGDGAEFMAFKIGNSVIGLPGFWYSTIRMLAAVSASAEEDPERLISLNWRENDFLRWAMGRTSPIVRAADEIVEGRDFLGRRLDDPEDWFGQFSEYFMTIAAVNLRTRHPNEEEGKFRRFGAELLGLRAFPRSDWAKLTDMKEEYAHTEFKKPFDQLNMEDRDKLLAKYPDYKALTEEARERFILEKGEDLDIWLWSTRKMSDAIYHGTAEDAARSLLAGQIDYKTYLDTESYLRKVYKGKKWAINYISQQADPEAVEDFTKYLEEQSPEDKALSRYWEIYANPAIRDGVVDWDATEKTQKAFLESLTPEVRDYIVRNKDKWMDDLPPTVKKLALIQVQGREKVEEYYNQPEGRARLDYRRANPTVDAWLILMGRVTKPLTQMALQHLLEMMRTRNLPPLLFPNLTEMVSNIGGMGVSPTPQMAMRPPGKASIVKR